MTVSPSARPKASAVAADTRARAWPGRCRRGTARRPAGSPGRAGGARSPGRARRHRRSADLAGRDGGSGWPLAGPRAERGHLGADLGQRAGAEEDAELAGEHVEDAVVGHARRSPAPPRTARTRPSQLTKVPPFSACGGDREHDVGDSGHRRRAKLERDDEGLGERLLGARVGEVAGVDAADDQGVDRSPDARGLDDAGRVAAGSVGQPDDVPGLGDLLAGCGVGDRAATGQQRRQRAGLERTALTGATRHPRRGGRRWRRPARQPPTARRAPWPGARRRG